MDQNPTLEKIAWMIDFCILKNQHYQTEEIGRKLLWQWIIHGTKALLKEKTIESAITELCSQKQENAWMKIL